jgi:hypothetical protein
LLFHCMSLSSNFVSFYLFLYFSISFSPVVFLSLFPLFISLSLSVSFSLYICHKQLIRSALLSHSLISIFLHLKSYMCCFPSKHLTRERVTSSTCLGGCFCIQ